MTMVLIIVNIIGVGLGVEFGCYGTAASSALVAILLMMVITKED